MQLVYQSAAYSDTSRFISVVGKRSDTKAQEHILFIGEFLSFLPIYLQNLFNIEFFAKYNSAPQKIW